MTHVTQNMSVFEERAPISTVAQRRLSRASTRSFARTKDGGAHSLLSFHGQAAGARS